MKPNCIGNPKIHVIIVFSLILISHSFAHQGSETTDESNIALGRFLINKDLKMMEESSQDKTTLFDIIVLFLNKREIKKDSIEEKIDFLDELLEKMKENTEKEKILLQTLDIYHDKLDELIKSSPTKQSITILEKKMWKDILFFNELFADISLKAQHEVLELLKLEIEMLVDDKDLNELILVTNKCDKTISSIQFTCYYKVFEQSVTKSEIELHRLIESIKEKQKQEILSTVECHYLHHGIGYLLYKEHGMPGIQRCPETYDACSFGCHHGIAEEIFYEKQPLFEKGSILEDTEFQKISGANYTYELFNLYHGFGHAFYANVNNIPKSQLLCKSTSDGDFTRKTYCDLGISHEAFSNTVFKNISIQKAKNQCNHFSTNKNGCYYMLGLVYADNNFEKTLQFCKKNNISRCIRGVGAYIDVWKADSNINKAVDLCKKKFKDEQQMLECISGSVAVSLYFYNDVNRGYEICNIDTKLKEKCLKELWNLFAVTYLVKHKEMCDFVDLKYRGQCKREFKKYNIT